MSAVYELMSKAYTTFDKTDDPWMTNGLSSTPFRSLVSGCLSTVTVTTRVVSACVPLYKKVSTFEQLLALDDEELREIIKPVAHYNRKTEGLKIMARQIIEDFDGRIPDNRDDLLKLHGVGNKVADLMMNFLFSEERIAVDTHILRLWNRLGFVETTSAEKATEAINAQTPKRYKRHAHEWLIQHGMKVCVARMPKCGECMVTKYCDWFKQHEPLKSRAANAEIAP
ncbi:endonuclease III domain-containing protein [Variovorax sp. RHLX14]|uniref:endonuclease III domain-containing protein n=1 Tax=Variovorax sp. RHLX14 TaxID=1259731 RepID=UPI003F466110